MDIREIIWETYGETVLNPIALSLTIIMCIMVIFIKREYVLLAFIIIACFITNKQRIVIFDIDFPMLRILSFVGYARIFLGHDERSMKFNKIDKFIIFWGMYRLIAHTLLWRASWAFIETLGNTIDTIGIYFLVRVYIYDLNDFNKISKTLIISSVLIALLMIIEKKTGRNIFSVFGGVPEFNIVREGKLRAQGAFSHPIMAGSFGAFLLPISFGLLYTKNKIFGITGLITSFIITITCASSGPIIGYLSGIGGIFIWRLRHHVKKIKWMAIIILVALHIVMKAPVWHLLSRIDISGGSTGYHRYALIDAAISRFSEWFLVGLKTAAHWGWGLQDTTNQYIFEGQYGGILQLILFIMIIRYCFKTIGFVTNHLEDMPHLQKYIWSIGVILFIHAVSFMGVSYFGQMNFFYYFSLAWISGLNNYPEITNIINKEEKEET